MPFTGSEPLVPLKARFNAILTEAKNYVDGLFAANRPHIFRAQSAAETLTTATQTKIGSFGTVIDGGLGITYGAGDWTVAAAGTYNVVGQVAFASNSTGDRRAYIYRNSSVVAKTTSDANASFDTVIGVAVQMKCSAGDVISLRALHTRGSNLATVAGDTQMSISWLHP